MNDLIRVIVADDHPIVRAGLHTILAAGQGVELVGEATNGDEAWQLCRDLQPDVLLLDLHMPGPTPLETVTYLREQYPALKILILTAYNEDAYVHSLAAAGVAGYVLKDEASEVVVQAIHKTAEGGKWFSQPVVEKLVNGLPEEAQLDDRERQILGMIARSWSNGRIATELGLAEQTVRNYVSQIYTKLKLDSRVQAALWAREHGIK